MARANIKTGWQIAVVMAAALSSGAPSLAEDRRGEHERRGEADIVVGVDALGLIEHWYAHQAPPAPPSSAVVTHGGATLLFRCAPDDALYVTIEPPPPGVAVPGFGCGRGEELIALRGSGLACRNVGWEAVEPPDGTAVIVIAESGRKTALIGECVGQSGIVSPAAVGSQIVAEATRGAPPPCPANQSSVTFRGQLTAGGC